MNRHDAARGQLGPTIATAGGVLAISAAVALAIVQYHWLGLAMVLLGVGFLALVSTAPLTALLAWLVASPILDFYMQIPLGAGIPDITFTRMTILTVFLIILLQSIFRMRALLPVERIEFFMLAFAGIAVFGIALKGDVSRSLQLLVDGYLAPFAVFFLAKNLVRTREDVTLFLTAVAALGLYLALIGCVQYFTGATLFVPEGFSSIHAQRAHGPFNNAVQYGGVLAIAIFGSACLYGRVGHGVGRALTLGIVLLSGFGVFLSLTRAVWVSLLAGVVVIYRYLPRYRRLLRTLAAVTVLVMGAVWVASPGSSVLKQRTLDAGPIYSRMVLYATALRTAADHPLLGHGFGRYSFYDASREHLASFGEVDMSAFGTVLTVPHNEFLHILVMMGALGLFAYVAIFYESVRTSRDWFRALGDAEPQWRHLIVMYWAALAVFLVNALFVDLFFFSFFSAFFFMFAGVVDGSRQRVSVAGRPPSTSGVAAARVGG